jgi:hypothetical protein
MKTPHPELRAILQFDSGRWKLRLERVPVHPDNETTMGVDFGSAEQARANETIGCCYQSSAADANDKYPVERIGRVSDYRNENGNLSYLDVISIAREST